MSDRPPRPDRDDDDVAGLIRFAGRREAVPPERIERVRAAARAEWKGVVRRRRRRVAWTAGGAAAACLAVAFVFRFPPFGGGAIPTPEEPVRVEALAGAAWSEPLDAPPETPRAPLRVGGEIGLRRRVATEGEGRAALRLPSGHALRLDASTSVRLLDGGALALERGAVYVDSMPDGAPREPVEVRTPLGTVREVGTRFEVRLDGGTLRVRLREGAVSVRRDGRTHDLEAGNEIELDRDGSPVRRPIAIHGPPWQWIEAVTPTPDFEGRSAREFLDWVARERGLTLAFADEDVARSAGETVLGGALGRLTLDDALDAVLPTCRLTYRVDDGRLWIAAIPERPATGV